VEFYPAEEHHQDYLKRNPEDPYIVFHDLPKLEALKRKFPALYRR
jgi:peptide-methionine (S)-S-oxide reductase